MSDTCDGCSRTTFVITTRTGLISDLGRTLPVVEFQHQGLRIATRLFLCRDLMGCITAIQSRLNNFQLRTRLVRCQDRTEIHARILAVEPLPLVSGTRRAVEDHAMHSAAFQGGASCIKDSAAFSFDEPHLEKTAANGRDAAHRAIFSRPVC